MKEQIKTPEKELSNEETANLSDVESKTLVIRMLTEMIEYNHKMKEEMKATQSEIKQKIYREPTVNGRKPRTQINNLEQKEEISIQPEQNKETRMQKNEERLQNLLDNLSVPTSESWEHRKENRKSRKLKTYLYK